MPLEKKAFIKTILRERESIIKYLMDVMNKCLY